MKLFKNFKKFLVKHNLIKDTFIQDGMVYFYAGKPTKEPTDLVKWLGDVTVYCFYKDMNKKCLELLEKNYPKYKGFIYLF